MLEAEDGTVLAAHGETIGVATNNVAEYRALVAGLAMAETAGVDELDVVSDSELLVKQMRGEYRVKNAALRELWEEAQQFGEIGIDRVSCYSAVRREHNELADRLVNEALERLSCRAIIRPSRGCSSVGRASACHAEGRGFEPHHPLHLRVTIGLSEMARSVLIVVMALGSAGAISVSAGAATRGGRSRLGL